MDLEHAGQHASVHPHRCSVRRGRHGAGRKVTIAAISCGTADRLAEAAEAERIARELNDPALLCFALSARYQQTFSTAGMARAREAIGVEITALAVDAELPTFEIQGRLIRMQALCALDDIDAASREADQIDALAARFDRQLATAFTGWFRWTFLQGPLPPAGDEMPGFRAGLPALAELTAAVRNGRELPDGDFGPHEPWVRPLLLAVEAGWWRLVRLSTSCRSRPGTCCLKCCGS